MSGAKFGVMFDMLRKVDMDMSKVCVCMSKICVCMSVEVNWNVSDVVRKNSLGWTEVSWKNYLKVGG